RRGPHRARHAAARGRGAHRRLSRASPPHSARAVEEHGAELGGRLFRAALAETGSEAWAPLTELLQSDVLRDAGVGDAHGAGGRPAGLEAKLRPGIRPLHAVAI